MCSEIGSKILQSFGSAVDATIATLLCSSLLVMQSMGLGGGFLMTVYSRSEQRSYTITAREVAPLEADPKRFKIFLNTTDLFHSALAIAVPGELMGYAVAHEHFGKLPWSALVEPTLEICRSGYRLTRHQRDALLINQNMITMDPILSAMFISRQSGRFFRVGSLIKPPATLCDTYESLAKDGPRSFYSGDLAVRVSDDLDQLGSIITRADLSGYRAKFEPAFVMNLGDYRLHLTLPPGSGHIVGLVMNILQNYEEDFRRAKKMDVLEVHRIVEALKIAFVQRWSSEEDMNPGLLQNITNAQYTETLCQLISDLCTFEDAQHYGANFDLISQDEFGTGHISLIAPNGDAVSVTSSINFYFGTGRSGFNTGIVFNNAMVDFSLPGSRNYFDLPNIINRNEIKPGRRPMSSMSPIIVTGPNGDVSFVIGAAGGSKIISVLSQILVRLLWMDENIKQAIDAPRFHHQLLPDKLEYEFGLLRRVVEGLASKGHKTIRYRERGSAVCGIQRTDDGFIYGNADYRKEGNVAGF